MSSTPRTLLGEPLRVIVLAHTHRGPCVYRTIGATLAEQLRHAASIMNSWAEMDVARNVSVWLKPTAKSSWELA